MGKTDSIKMKVGRSEKQREKSSHGHHHGLWLAISWTICYISWIFMRVSAAAPYPISDTTSDLLRLIEFGAAITLLILWAIIYWHHTHPTPSKQAATPQHPPSALTRDQMYLLSPREFEEFVGRLFTQKGYVVKIRGGSGDLGVDLEIERDGREAIVQCKRYQRTVGPDAVRELYGTLMHEKVTHAFLVTSANISSNARHWARKKPMTLIDGDTLAKISTELGIKIKQDIQLPKES